MMIAPVLLLGVVAVVFLIVLVRTAWEMPA